MDISKYNEKKEVGKVEQRSPFRILFVSFSSGWHEDVWNVLAIESLTGDLCGHFGNLVEVDTVRSSCMPDVEKIADSIKENNYDMIGYSLDIGSQEFFLSLLRRLNSCSLKCTMVCGGTLATYAYDYIMEKEEFMAFHPFIVLGEGEIALRDIVQKHLDNMPLRMIDNILSYDEIKKEYVKGQFKPVDLKELIYPPVHITYFKQEHKVHILQSSRNCVFSCSYCSQGPNKQWRSFSYERIERNMENLINNRIYEFEYVDDEFFGGTAPYYIDRAWKIADIISGLEEKYQISLQFRLFTNPCIICSKNTGSNGKGFYELLQYYKKLGLCRVYLGVESGSIEQRNRYNRKDSLQDCKDAIHMLNEIGLIVDAGFIMFDPEVQLDDINFNIEFIREVNFLKYNTWPFRHMTLTANTPMFYRVRELELLRGRSMNNPASYRYEFLNESVRVIYSAVEVIASCSSKVFYILKYFYKEYCYNSHEQEKIDMVYGYLMKNASINLDYIQDMIRDLQENKSIEKSTMRIRRRLFELIKTIEANIFIFDSFDYSTDYLVEGINGTLQSMTKYLKMKAIESKY